MRKARAGILAETDASTRQTMDIFGYEDIDHAERYSREANPSRLAMEGMSKIIKPRRRA